MKIYLDYGHGGVESGAVATDGRLEKDLNLLVGNKCYDGLLRSGFDVMRSRCMDMVISLEDRCSQANNWGADLFISIHHNAGGGDGFEVIHSVNGCDSKVFADILGSEYLAFNNCRSIYSRESDVNKGQDYYYVIRRTKMPSVISEFCFIDDNDLQAFDSDKECQALVRACVRYRDSKHWAYPSWIKLKESIRVEESRFDDKVSRGELFALLCQVVDKIR